jgi:hypothetical protein
MATAISGSDYQDSTKSVIAYGVTGFAGMMLATVAIFQILEGISAIAKNEIYVTTVNYAYKFDLTAWGWVHLILGVIALATGIGIVLSQTWGYVVGIAVAVLGAVTSFAFLPYEPLWSLVIVAFNVFVIWGLCTRLRYDDTV